MSDVYFGQGRLRDVLDSKVYRCVSKIQHNYRLPLLLHLLQKSDFRGWNDFTFEWTRQSIFISWKSKMNVPIVVLISVSPYLQITADAIIVCIWQNRNSICSGRHCAVPSVRFFNDSELDQIATWQSNTQLSLCVDKGECCIEFRALKFWFRLGLENPIYNV